MRRLLPTLLALALLLAPGATGQDDGGGADDGEAVEARVTMHGEGGEHWFACEGPVCNEGRDPAMVLEPGRTYRFHVTNAADVPHDLHLGDPVGAATDLLQPGQEADLSFTVPGDAEGDASYWCAPHQGLGMGGTIVFETAAVGGGPVDNDSPGPGAPLLAAALGAVLLLADRARQVGR